MKVYQIITDRIISKLEQGTIPWHMPWKAGKGGIPMNLTTGKQYRGINVFILMMSGWSSPYWLTFKQVKKLKGCVKTGEKGTPVIYWNWVKVTKDTAGNEVPERKIPFIKYYTVFNSDQCVDLKHDSLTALEDQGPVDHVRILANCEKIVHLMPKAPPIDHEEARAYYVPREDRINMPKIDLFEGSEEYYSTLYHELVHSTGHKSRLNRHEKQDANCNFGSQDYSKEELVAEMGAAMLCGVSGIETKTIDNSAAYIQSWLSKLKGDPKLVIYAGAQAQKAADFIQDIKPETDPGQDKK